MSDQDQVLSQDDIDALLSGGGPKKEEPKQEAAAEMSDAEALAAQMLSGQDADEPAPVAEAETAAVVEPDADSKGGDNAWGLGGKSTAPAPTPTPAVRNEPVGEYSPPPPSETFRRTPGNGTSVPRDLDFILDIPLQLRVEVGRTRVNIAELLTYGPGAVVQLDKLAGEPLEIYVNDKLVARGEAVVVNEKFGVRLTDVVSKTERIENLG